MANGRSLRRIADPVVASVPAGVRIRTRIHPTAAEAEALTAIGELLGSLYRGELAERIRLGRLDRKAHGTHSCSVVRNGAPSSCKRCVTMR